MNDDQEVDAFRRPRQRMYAVIPTLLTLGNAVCGFGAITFAAMVGPEQLVSVSALAESGLPPPKSASDLLFVSAGLIFLAMVFDALDGSVARLTKQTSDFGAELDSLCDGVSFGVRRGRTLTRSAADVRAGSRGVPQARGVVEPRVGAPR